MLPPAESREILPHRRERRDAVRGLGHVLEAHQAYNLAEKTPLAIVVRAPGFSPSRLAHLFRAETGQTPQRYLQSLRMQRATALLQRTGFSIKQIEATVGFESPFYFAQRFKARTNHSPSSFRDTKTPLENFENSETPLSFVFPFLTPPFIAASRRLP